MSSDNHIPLDPRGGKGSKWRRMNYKKYRDNFDAIFGKKEKESNSYRKESEELSWERNLFLPDGE